ncbi:hypothetical protein JTB14_011093 [Gonioctena quinquepunctata]|nr:hypothetical protein JTB14_011093 [Gonioctena quinquepunctata]
MILMYHYIKFYRRNQVMKFKEIWWIWWKEENHSIQRAMRIIHQVKMYSIQIEKKGDILKTKKTKRFLKLQVVSYYIRCPELKSQDVLMLRKYKYYDDQKMQKAMMNVEWVKVSRYGVNQTTSINYIKGREFKEVVDRLF